MGKLERFLRSHAIGLVALVVALSGTAYAANKIGAHDIKRNAIRSVHIKDGQVKRGDLARSLRGGLSGGEQLQVKQVEGAALHLNPGEFDGAPIAECPAGYEVVGTGFNASIGEAGFVLAFGSFVGGFFNNGTSLPIEANVQAICAKNSGGGATLSSDAQLRRFHRAVAAAAAQAG